MPTVKNEINFGTLIPIVLFLIVQTAGGVWWASAIHSTVGQTVKNAHEYYESNNEENLRQWSRINAVEDQANEILSNERALTTLMSRMESDLRTLRNEMKTTNELLREILIANARRDALDGSQTHQ